MKTVSFKTADFREMENGHYKDFGEKIYNIVLNDDDTMTFIILTTCDNKTFSKTMKIKTNDKKYYYLVKKTQINTTKQSAEELFIDIEKDVKDNFIGTAVSLVNAVLKEEMSYAIK